MYTSKFLVILVCLLNFMTIDSLNITNAYELSGTGLIRKLADFIEDNSEFNPAGQCIRDILFWKRNFFTFQPWALSMFDAGGKFPSGLLSGNIISLGQFDQCLRVKYDDDPNRIFEGKYCLAKLPLSRAFRPDPEPESFNRQMNHNIDGQGDTRVASFDVYGRRVLNWAICLPSTCETSEIRDLVNAFWTAISVDLEFPIITIPEESCTTNEKLKWTTGDWLCLAFFVAFALTILLSTSYDLYINFIKKDRPRHHNVLASFSLYTNTARLITVSDSSSSLGCLHGIRVLSMFWVIIGHRYGTIAGFPLINTFDIIRWNETFASMMIIAGLFAVDTFLVLSGFLLSYVFFKKHKNRKSFNLILFYFHRFLRLTPPLVALIFFNSTLFKHIGSGPLWTYAYKNVVNTCQQVWWLAILYLQNYLSKSGICINHTWYISIDAQLYVLSPILIYPLLRNRKIGIANMIAWIIIAQITVTTIVYVNDFSASLIWNGGDYFSKFYQATHARAVPWLLGFAAGFFVQNMKQKEINMNKILVGLLWISSLAIMAATIFGLKPLHSIYHEVNKLEDGTYNAFAKTGWSIALIWVIFACIHGYGGPINWFLSWKCWEILGRISYSMYLTHVFIQDWFTFSSRVVIEFSHFSIFYTFFGDLVITILISYLWVMAFESPFMVLEKAVFSKKDAVPSKPEPNKIEPTNEQNANLEEIIDKKL